MQKNGSASQLESRIGSLKESVRNLVDAGGERAGHLKERAKEMKGTVADKGGAALERMGEMIKKHPIASLGIAFGIGYFAVRMLRK